MIKHIVLLRFKSEVPHARVSDHEILFQDLRKEIPINYALEWGTNVSPEGLNADFTHCFLLEFEDANDRDQYLTHPAHVAFSKQIKASLEAVLVFDYEAN